MKVPEKVTLEYADGFYFKEDSMEGSEVLWEELERRYNAHNDLLEALRVLSDCPVDVANDLGIENQHIDTANKIIAEATK